MCAWLGMATAAWAQAGDDATADPVAQLALADKDLKAIRNSLEDAETLDSLKTLSDRALDVQRRADAAQTALQPRLEQLEFRISQLGAVAEGEVEARELTQQRKALNQERADAAAAIA